MRRSLLTAILVITAWLAPSARGDDCSAWSNCTIDISPAVNDDKISAELLEFGAKAVGASPKDSFVYSPPVADAAPLPFVEYGDRLILLPAAGIPAGLLIPVEPLPSQPAGLPSYDTIARRAWAEVRLPSPDIRTRPPVEAVTQVETDVEIVGPATEAHDEPAAVAAARP